MRKTKEQKNRTNRKHVTNGRNKFQWISNHNKYKWAENLPMKGQGLLKWILENSALYFYKRHILKQGRINVTSKRMNKIFRVKTI